MMIFDKVDASTSSSLNRDSLKRKFITFILLPWIANMYLYSQIDRWWFKKLEIYEELYVYIYETIVK